jgi:hypothetical protein
METLHQRTGRVLVSLHDNETQVGGGIAWRGEEVDVTVAGAARFLDEKLAYVVLLLEKMADLLVHRLTGNVREAAGNDIALLASTMSADDVNRLVEAHDDEGGGERC